MSTGAIRALDSSECTTGFSPARRQLNLATRPARTKNNGTNYLKAPGQ